MSYSSKIEATANAATIVVAAFLCIVLVRVYLLPKPQTRRTISPSSPLVPQTTVGTDMKPLLRGVNWAASKRTLVLAISTQCHFCRDSMPFFRTLSGRLSGQVRIVAVLPQPIAAAEHYLRGEHVRVDKVLQVSPAVIGARGTPTMLLVDQAGIVTNVWVGELQPRERRRVLNVLGIPRRNSAGGQVGRTAGAPRYRLPPGGFRRTPSHCMPFVTARVAYAPEGTGMPACETPFHESIAPKGGSIGII